MLVRPFITLLAVLSVQWGFSETLQTYEDVQSALKDIANEGQTVDLTGEVCSYTPRTFGGWLYGLRIGPHQLTVYENPVDPNNRRQFGLLDRIRVYGRLFKYGDHLLVGYEKADVLSRGDASNLPLITPRQVYDPRFSGQLVRVAGTVRDAARDDSDPDYIHLTIRDGDGQAQIMLSDPVFLKSNHRQYIGAKIVVIGTCSDNKSGLRHHVGRLLAVSGLGNAVIVKPANSFDNAPNIETLSHALPQHIASVGHHSCSGTVLATWRNECLLLRTASGRIVKIRLLAPGVPSIGATVRVLGLPVTDFYNHNLIHATWQLAKSECASPDAPVPMTANALLVNELGHPQLMVRNHGKAIRMTGIVRYLPDATHPNARMQIESDGQIVAVDTTSRPALLSGLEIGCRISVAGTCVMEADNWNFNSAEDVNRGFFLVPRTADDIVIISRPPWWTPGRLLALLGIFAATLLGVLAWNVSLNRRAKAKGRELAAEQLAHVTSELKVNERTRLAVELHDALSQTLTGVSMQIDTAAGFAEGKLPAITKCLGLASRTIDACRTELRNTLWDLRSAALDEPSMDAAIRKTLCQNLAGIDLSVRFNVAREAFSDNTAHAILKIIRELATNALRHGKASSLKIAGTIDDGKLLFSVRDNGCGFDPDLAPGISQGHFGLQGIAERLERLNGEMKIESMISKGAKVTVVLPIPRSGE